MDIKHYYLEKGQGEPLILLHGNGESCGYFKNQIGEFSKGYHVYAVDTRGHGKTPRGSSPFTIRQFAEDLSEFMDEQKIVRAHLLGFSDGGNIAMMFAVHHPEKVNRLIINGGNLYARGVKPSVQIPIEIGYRIAAAYSKKSNDAGLKAEMLGLMVNEPDLSPGELSRIKAMTLVIAGTRDMIKGKHTQLIAESIPGAELAFVRGDHFIANKNPEDFNRRVLEFLKK